MADWNIRVVIMLEKKRTIKIEEKKIKIFNHCVKNFQMRRFFWSVFSCNRTEYRDLLR